MTIRNGDKVIINDPRSAIHNEKGTALYMKGNEWVVILDNDPRHRHNSRYEHLIDEDFLVKVTK